MENTERTAIYEMVLEEMSKKFTSNDFCALSKQLGVPDKDIHHGRPLHFFIRGRIK